MLKSKSLPDTKRGKQHQISVYLKPETLRRLRALSEKTGAPMAHFLREGVELVIRKHGVPSRTSRPVKESKR